jgi:hypothetical protein
VSGHLAEIAGVRAWLCDDAGPALDERLATDIIGESLGAGVGLVVIPTARLSPAFLDLRTRLAGELLQKFVNYQRQVAILGDVSAATARSEALRDFVRESNRGRAVWFVADLAELEARLAAVR